MMNDTPQPRPSGTGAVARLRMRWGGVPGNLRGGVWLVAAAGLLAAMAALIKLAGQTLHVTEILLFRQIFMLLFALPAILPSFPQVLKSDRVGLQLLRIVAAMAAMLLSFTAFIHLPLAEVITITFSRAFFTTIFAILILHEIVGLRRWSAMVAGFAGVLIVAQPDVSGGMNVYGLMAIGGAACAGLVMVIIRLLSRTERPLTILTWQALGVGLLMLPPAIWFWKTPTLTELAILAAIGAVSGIAQMCNIYAFRAGEASAIAPLDYTRLVWAALLGLALFGEWPGGHVFAGAGVIIAAGLYTMYREQQLGKRHPPDGAPPPV